MDTAAQFITQLIYLFLMPLVKFIPMACLAGILVVVSYNMSEWRSFKAILKNPKSDIIVLLVTFFLTVIFDLTVAIEVGVLIACLLCMKRMAETTNVSVLSDEIDPSADTYVLKLTNTVLLLTLLYWSLETNPLSSM